MTDADYRDGFGNDREAGDDRYHYVIGTGELQCPWCGSVFS